MSERLEKEIAVSDEQEEKRNSLEVDYEKAKADLASRIEEYNVLV